MYKISWPHADIVDKLSLSPTGTFFLGVISQKSANNCTAIRKKIILVKKKRKITNGANIHIGKNI